MTVYRDPGECEHEPQKEMPSLSIGHNCEEANIARTWSQADGPYWADSSPSRSREPLTKEERESERERRKTHHTRAWYCRQLLAVASGELVLTKRQHQALLTFGRVRGYHRHPAGKR